ncbi:MAG: putative ABC transporter permease subunit [Christensenellales bacterium]|jgi:ABC-2 type transport system permease protein
MRKILLLTKILLKSGGALLSNKRGRLNWILPAVLVFAFASFAFSTIMFTFMMYDSLAPVGIADIIIPLAFGAASIVIFLFGVFYVISVMYYANDIEMLMYLPLRPFHILGAKFLTLVVYEYIFEAFILLPMLAAYGIKSGAGLLYVVYSALLFILLPLIALSMAAVIVMVVMRFTSFGKNKQAFKFIGGIIAVGLAIGFNIVIQTSVSNIDQAQFITIMQNSSLASVISNIFPGIVFASGTLINSDIIDGLFNLILFILCSFAAVGVFIGFGQLLYLKGVAGVSETSAKRKEIRDIGKETIRISSGKAYVKKEIRLLFRSPIAFLNCVMINVIWPVILVVMVLSGGDKILAVTAFITTTQSALLIAIIVGASAFLSSSNAITSTAISREGKSLYFTKYIPMSMQQQLAAKTITGMILSGISVVLLIVIAVIFGVDIITALISLALSLLVMAVCSMGGLLIDVANPKLDWMNEQQAIKQNLNVVLHMLLGLLFAAVAIVPVLLIGMSVLAAVLYIAIVFLLIFSLLTNRIKTYAAVKLNNMDV